LEGVKERRLEEMDAEELKEVIKDCEYIIYNAEKELSDESYS